MKIKKEETLRTYTSYSVKRYCCKDMEKLLDFGILTFENGEIIASGHTDLEYSYRKAIKFCPFCGEPIEQV